MYISKLLLSDKIPKRDFFTKPEVAQILHISMEQLFFWESEFPQIRSIRTNNNRLYGYDDVVLFFAIKNLVYDKKLSIALTLKTLAELDSISVNDAPEQHELISSEAILQDSSALLDSEEDGFDEIAHTIYQECAQEIERASIETRGSDVGAMLGNALSQKQRKELLTYKHEEIYQTRALLLDKRKSLNEVLDALERLQPAILQKI